MLKKQTKCNGHNKASDWILKIIVAKEIYTTAILAHFSKFNIPIPIMIGTIYNKNIEAGVLNISDSNTKDGPKLNFTNIVWIT